MKLSTLLKLIRFWPPLLGAGIRVAEFNDNYTWLRVEMKMHFWNKNYVGSHFGGSLYSMTDPFYMLMLIHLLGKDYIVWDKSANIRYLKPGFGRVFAEFSIAPDEINVMRDHLDKHGKYEPVFIIHILDSKSHVIAEIEKTISIKKRISDARS